jgi:parvulin-like peptidyl-prolyl isomerase
MKLLRIGLAALILPVWFAGTVAARIVERIVAVVGGDVILKSDLDERMRPVMNEVEKEADPKAREKKLSMLQHEVLDRLVDEQLILQQAADLKVQVSPDDVDKAVDDIKKQNNITDQQLEAALKDQGISMTSYRQDLKRQITRLKVIGIAVRSRVTVSDDDIKTYYDQNVRASGADRKVKASHIFIAIPEAATTSDVEQKREFAAGLVQRARGGEDFAKLAREHSEDPATRQSGGDLGWFGKGALPPAVEEIVFGMEPGEVRGPIRAERGFHVIKLMERKDEQAKPFAEVKEQLRAQLFQQEMEKQTRTWLQELRKKAHIDTRLDRPEEKVVIKDGDKPKDKAQ